MITEEFIFEALQAEREGEKFPVDFDQIWGSSGYSARRNAVRKLSNSRLKIEIDFRSLKSERARQEGDFDKYFLTVDAAKSFLLAANTDEGEEVRRYFIEVEKKYRENLNSLLARSENAELELLRQEVAELRVQLHQSRQNHLDFSYSAKQLWAVSGIVNFCQVKAAIKRDFTEGRDWVELNSQLFVNEPTYYILLVSFRSLRGTDLSQLPDIIQLETKLYFQYQAIRRQNKRVAQECPDQLNVDI